MKNLLAVIGFNGAAAFKLRILYTHPDIEDLRKTIGFNGAAAFKLRILWSTTTWPCGTSSFNGAAAFKLRIRQQVQHPAVLVATLQWCRSV